MGSRTHIKASVESTGINIAQAKGHGGLKMVKLWLAPTTASTQGLETWKEFGKLTQGVSI